MTDAGNGQLVLISSLYLPLRELLFLIRDADQILVDEQEIWQKQSLRNRSYILGPNGVQCLTVPVEHGAGRKAPVSDIRISYRESWVRVHKGALFSAYNSSPFFEYFKDALFAIYDRKPTFLTDLNAAINHLLFAKLKLPAPQVFKEPAPGPITDLRSFSDLARIQTLPPLAPYPQVFSYKSPFAPELSVLDLLSNKGGF
ncbi:MAG: WbqC family protein [Bacteroidia bacterium]|nr:WbqC family protein [Bacteroidia bacterium]